MYPVTRQYSRNSAFSSPVANNCITPIILMASNSPNSPDVATICQQKDKQKYSLGPCQQEKFLPVLPVKADRKYSTNIKQFNHTTCSTFSINRAFSTEEKLGVCFDHPAWQQ